jgi:hypothetical protein
MTETIIFVIIVFASLAYGICVVGFDKKKEVEYVMSEKEYTT